MIRDLDAQALDAGTAILRAYASQDRDLALDACGQVRAVLDRSPEFAILVRLPWDRGEGEPAMLRMRATCRVCAHGYGIVRRTRGQDVVRCSRCGVYAYCAPRAEVAP